MRGVGAFPYSAEAVQSRNSQASGEVSVRASADRGFVQLPAQSLRNVRRPFVERRHPASPLHRRTVYASRDLQRAFAVEWFQRAQLAVDSRGVLHPRDSHIERSHGLRGNDPVITRVTKNVLDKLGK